MIKKLKIGLLLLSFVACTGQPKTEITVIDGFTQGSTFHILIKDGQKHDSIVNQIDSILLTIDNSMSVFNKNSLISKINRAETDSLDSYLLECITIANKISKESEGMYDITIKPLTAAYGFTGDSSTYHPNIDSLLQFVGYEKISIENKRIIKIKQGIQLDLNSVAQGYTTDIICRYFDSLGFKDYIVEVGGEIFSRGTNKNGKAWLVGIDKPIDDNNTPGAEIQVTMNLSGRGLATSGNYRKYYLNKDGQKIVHMVNPKNGETVISNMLSATVVAENATIADVYGTFFMVVGLEKTIEFLNSHKEIDAYLVYSGKNGEFKTYSTSGLDLNL